MCGYLKKLREDQLNGMYEFQRMREHNPMICKPDEGWLKSQEKLINEDDTLDEHDKFCATGVLYCDYNEQLEEYEKYLPLQKIYEALESKLIRDWIQEMNREEQRELYDELNDKNWYGCGGLTMEESIIENQLRKIFGNSKIENLQESVYRQRKMDLASAKTEEEKFAAYQCLYD